MEHRSHRIKIGNIPEGKTVYSSVRRPLPLIMISLLFSLMVFLLKYIYLSLIMMFIGIILYLVFYRKQITGYDRFIVIYDQLNTDYCDIVYFSEINYWEYRITGKGDKIVFYLNDGEKFRIENGINNGTHAYLHKYLGDRELKSREERLSKGL